MSQSNSASNHFGWSVYKGANEEIRKQFLIELNLDKTLNLVTWQGQVDMLDGAPDDVLVEYIPKVYWMAQVELFRKHLSVGAMKEVQDKLDPLAKRVLKIEEPVVLMRRWHR